jgi:hypothetical protein
VALPTIRYKKQGTISKPNSTKATDEMKPMMFLLLVICICGCKDEGTPPAGHQRTITLALEDVGTTDAWLRVRFTDAPPFGLHLVRDGQAVVTINSSPADTLVGDEVLLPRRTYTYRAYRLSGTSVTDSSDAVQVTTMDSTSSAWQWALDTLGVMNSYLVDCAIIAPDNIWVVGTIYARDSLGNVEDVPHNAARWNGVNWELKRIPFIGPCSAVDYPPLTAIWTFSASNILVTNGGAIVRYDGTHAVLDCGMNSLLSGALNKIYGSNPQNLYAVGGAGTIVRFDGTTWQRQESGTTLALSDVYGVSANEVYATGNSRAFSRGVVLKGNGQTWQTLIVSESADTIGLFQTRLYGGMEGLWVDERGTLYTVGNMMFQRKHARWEYMRSLPGNCVTCNPDYLHQGYLLSVRGNASNDMFVCGQINTLKHFNGVRWTQVGIPYHPLRYDIFWYSTHIKGNVAVAVGEVRINFGRGLVMRMWR